MTLRLKSLAALTVLAVASWIFILDRFSIFFTWLEAAR